MKFLGIYSTLDYGVLELLELLIDFGEIKDARWLPIGCFLLAFLLKNRIYFDIRRLELLALALRRESAQFVSLQITVLALCIRT